MTVDIIREEIEVCTKLIKDIPKDQCVVRNDNWYKPYMRKVALTSLLNQLIGCYPDGKPKFTFNYVEPIKDEEPIKPYI